MLVAELALAAKVDHATQVGRWEPLGLAVDVVPVERGH
jgi:hypothetical protein